MTLAVAVAVVVAVAVAVAVAVVVAVAVAVGQKWRSRVDAARSSSPKCCTCHAKSVSGQKPLPPSYQLKRQARKNGA